jgi:biotin-[acetyl-CoA-carboxylase] ligase BirA-like protein
MRLAGYKMAILALASSRIRSTRAFLLGSLITAVSESNSCAMSSMNAESSASRQEEIILSTHTIQIHHLKYTVESTQDEARRLVQELYASSVETAATRTLCVIADNQRAGRGTGGRTWVAQKGNLFLTCAVPMDLIPMSMITLLPLGIGVVVAQSLNPVSNVRPVVKWPNDVLLDEKKVAGTLIENFQHQRQLYWLVGIGVNVESHPEQLPSEKGDHLSKPRSATCLLEHIDDPTQAPSAVKLGENISMGLVEFTRLLRSGDAATIVNDWKSWAALGRPYTIRETGEEVITVDVQLDGQLQVIGQDGRHRVLVADYFY